MTTPQPGIFHEGTTFHWFLHFRVRPDAPPSAIRAAIQAIQAVADAGSPPETVTLVVGFGRSLLQRLAPNELPAGLHDFTEVTGTSGRTAVATQEDVFFWAHSNRHDRNYEVARDARRAFAPIGELARETPSFVYRDSRDLTGFIDGTENPDAAEARTLAVLGEGQTGEGGSFVLTQRWIHDLDAFHAMSIEDQEAVFGRTKVDSTEIEDKAPTAHLSRVVIEDDAGEEIEIYRRSVPDGTAVEAGLYFLAFTDDLAKIDRMLANMYGASGDGAHDRVVEFTQTVSGAYYFAPSAEALARILDRVMKEFAGKTAVVTGAGSGIGRALARRFAYEGMFVVAADVEAPALAETVELIDRVGGRAAAVVTDVANAESVQELADTAFTDHGGTHVLCNNAGVFSGGLLWQRTLRDWQWVLGVNLYGIVHAIRSFVPRMIEQDTDCHIVNTASMGGLFTNAYSGPYYTSKFAAVGLTECLAHDLRSVGSKIGVSVLVPSLIATNIGRSDRNRPEQLMDPGLEEPPDVTFIKQALTDSTAGGIAPDEVAAIVIDAIVADDFYIPTKPSFSDQMQARYEDLLEHKLPRSPDID